ncbi:hypothetical protein ABZ442_27695 [Streptomyces triculaminicus]|uniref:hypothetical protein n=1 Tax=Streptomyces triculaminicus TaxID=2816232 RepID=UPI0033C4A536
MALTCRDPAWQELEDGITAASQPRYTNSRTAAALAQCGQDLLALVKELAAQHQLDSRTTPPLRPTDIELHLARICYSAALFEAASHRPNPARSHLLQHLAHPQLTLQSLMAGIEDHEAQDIVAMTTLAQPALTSLLQATAPHQVTLTPSLPTGNDERITADWLIGDLLIDVKATIHPEQLPLPDIYQLACFLLLDQQDTLHITRLGWYSARAGALIHFDTTEFLHLLGARHPLPTLRQQMAELWHRPTLCPAPHQPQHDPSPPPASVLPEPAALPKARRWEITHGERRYELTLVPGPDGTCQATMMVLSPEGEILSHWVGTTDPTDFGPLSHLLHLAAQQDPHSTHLTAPAPPAVLPPPAASRNGQRWSEEELERLRSLAATGTDPHTLARLLRRSERSVSFKLHQLHLAPFPTEQVRPRAQQQPGPQPAYTVENVRQTYPRAYERWTPEETARLHQRHSQGATISELAREFGRNEGAVSSRLALPPPP